MRGLDPRIRHEMVVSSNVEHGHDVSPISHLHGTRSPFRLLHSRSRFQPYREERQVIRKLKTGQYRLYSRKKNPKTGRRRNLGTFATRAAAQKHERAVQFFKRGG
jgi:hypothetical protein